MQKIESIEQLPFKISPWKHQLEGLRRAGARIDSPHTNNEFAAFFEAGAGKTLWAVNVLRYICLKEGRVVPTVIFCPAVVCKNWLTEIELHSKLLPYAFHSKGSGKKRLKDLQDAVSQGKKIIILNYEAIAKKDAPVFTYLLNSFRPHCLIYDESHRLKNHSSKTSINAWKLSMISEARFLLSGTPILNNEMDIFAQYRALDCGQTFGHKFFPFRMKYFADRNAGMPTQKYFPDWRIKAGAADTLNKLIYNKAMRVKKEDCLDLPPFVRKEVKVELTGDQKKAYKSMEAHFITFINGEACTAKIALTKALRLQQIACGFCVSEDGDEVVLKENAKLKALLDLLCDLESVKVIVWASFRKNHRQIAALLHTKGIDFVQLTGETKAADKAAAIDRFQNDPSCRVFLGNQAAGGIGVNLTAASVAIYFSKSFSLEQDIQSEARNYRGGSERHKSITRIDLVAEDTIDETVTKALARKIDISENILKELRRDFSR